MFQSLSQLVLFLCLLKISCPSVAVSNEPAKITGDVNLLRLMQAAPDKIVADWPEGRLKFKIGYLMSEYEGDMAWRGKLARWDIKLIRKYDSIRRKGVPKEISPYKVTMGSTQLAIEYPGVGAVNLSPRDHFERSQSWLRLTLPSGWCKCIGSKTWTVMLDDVRPVSAKEFVLTRKGDDIRLVQVISSDLKFTIDASMSADAMITVYRSSNAQDRDSNFGGRYEWTRHESGRLYPSTWSFTHNIDSIPAPEFSCEISDISLVDIPEAAEFDINVEKLSRGTRLRYTDLDGKVLSERVLGGVNNKDAEQTLRRLGEHMKSRSFIKK